MLQDFLTAAIEVLAVGFAIVMAIDFVQGLAQRIQESQQPAASTPQKEFVQSQMEATAAEPMSYAQLEDPWLTTLTPSVTQSKTAIAIAPPAPREKDWTKPDIVIRVVCWHHVGSVLFNDVPFCQDPLQPQLLLLPPAIVARAPVMHTRSSKAKPKKEWATAQAEVAGAALARLSAVQLRQQCSARGVQWRNAHGRGRHLTKNEMIARLTA